MNSVWQDKMGNEDSLSEALEKDKKDKTSKVLDKITDHYLTISKRKLSTKIQGFSLQDATPAAKGTTKDKSKPSKRAKFISAQLKTAKGLETNKYVQVGDDFRVVRTGDDKWTLQEATVEANETIYKNVMTVDDPALLRGQFGEEDASLVLTAEQQNQVNAAMEQI
jgi:hypothetical protein